MDDFLVTVPDDTACHVRYVTLQPKCCATPCDSEDFRFLQSVGVIHVQWSALDATVKRRIRRVL